MFYTEKDNKIVLFDENLERLENTLSFMPEYAGLEIKTTDRPIVDFQFADTDEFEQEKKQKEKERINSLSMTRSDFFDGTIKAFGTDSEELFIAIKNMLDYLEIGEIEKKVAINNYKNALNFYRSHSLFTLLSNTPIKISDDLTVTITQEQWDNFFDKTDKKDSEAYKELLTL